MNGRHFDFKDINLIPRKCIVGSRSECDTSIWFNSGKGKRKFNLPVIPANMECVINEELAEKLAREGYLYSMHRFADTVAFAKRIKEKDLFLSISIGVNEDSKGLLIQLHADNIAPDFVTIDIAHGHSIKMETMIRYVRSLFPSTTIMAGNVCTPQGVADLESWGTDIIKVGIGPGMACTTYVATGFGSRGCQASIIESCANAKTKNTTLICADGGIREPGDIAKAIALGADLVMVGGMFSGFTDSPGQLVDVNGKQYKEFWGSASHFQSNKSSRIEGTKKLVELKPYGILQEMNYIRECLQSAISYGGGKHIEDLKNVDYLIL